MNLIKPYIGITDFMNFEQVEAMKQVFDEDRPENCDYQFHVGVMMSHKTLNGLPTKWNTAFPAKESISAIFASPDVLNCLHYADYELRPELAQSLRTALSWAGPHLGALQLDMPWPDPQELTIFQRDFPNFEIILQVGKRSLAEVENSPQKMSGKLKQYEGLITRVLLDQSMGRGISLDANTLIPLLEVVLAHHSALGIVIAGGLGPTTLGLLDPIQSSFPELRFSIDAQGRLRTSGSALDPIDWPFAETYLAKAIRRLA